MRMHRLRASRQGKSVHGPENRLSRNHWTWSTKRLHYVDILRESKRLARLIHFGYPQWGGRLQPLLPEPDVPLSRYLGSLRSLSRGASASRFRDASTTFPFRNAHFRPLPSRAGFHLRGLVSPLPLPGYLSGPSCRGFQPLCQGLVDHPLYFVFESPLSTFADVSRFGLLQDYYIGSANIR